MLISSNSLSCLSSSMWSLKVKATLITQLRQVLYLRVCVLCSTSLSLVECLERLTTSATHNALELAIFFRVPSLEWDEHLLLGMGLWLMTPKPMRMGIMIQNLTVNALKQVENLDIPSYIKLQFVAAEKAIPN